MVGISVLIWGLGDETTRSGSADAREVSRGEQGNGDEEGGKLTTGKETAELGGLRKEGMLE